MMNLVKSAAVLFLSACLAPACVAGAPDQESSPLEEVAAEGYALVEDSLVDDIVAGDIAGEDVAGEDVAGKDAIVDGVATGTAGCKASLNYFRVEAGPGCPKNKWVCSKISLTGCTGAAITLTNPSGVPLTYGDSSWRWARACNCYARGTWRTRGWSLGGGADATWKKTF